MRSSRGRGRLVAGSAVAALVGATIALVPTPAMAVSPVCTSQTLTASATLTCTVPPGATVTYRLKGGNGGPGGAGGNGGHGGDWDNGAGGFYAGGAGGSGGAGGAGGAGALLTGSYTNTSGVDVEIVVTVGANGAAGNPGNPGINGTSGLTPSNGTMSSMGSNGSAGTATTLGIVAGSSIATANPGSGGAGGQFAQGGYSASSSGPGVAGGSGSAGTAGAGGTGGNAPTTIADQPSAEITFSPYSPSPQQPGGSTDAAPSIARPGWLTLKPTTECVLGPQGHRSTDDWMTSEAGLKWLTVDDRHLADWVMVPRQPDCYAPGNPDPDATILGWATTPDFPRAIAQRQADRDWGPYEIFDADGHLTALYIPAGWDTVITGVNRLYPIWSK